MKRTGYLIVAVSFVVACLVSVQEVLTLNWAIFVPVLISGFAGAVMAQFGRRRETKSVGRVAENIELLRRSLRDLATKLAELNARKHKINPYDVRHKIDELLVENLNDFADAREAVRHRYGVQNYADVMAHFAAGERYLNRVWSSSSDGYIDEVCRYLDRAEAEFKEALELMQRLGD